jgi:flagellin
MSLGILTNIAAIYAENNLNQTQASLQNTLTQLSSGSRINSGADDAAGLSVVDGLQANVSALTQSSQNASDGIGLLQTADGALSQVTNLLNRAVTLATEAANGTLNSNQVSSANAEYQNILTEIGDIGSSTNFNGNSVFTSTSKTVFVSDGTTTGSDSYNEVVGALTAGSVGQTVGTVTLSAPAATTPTATTTLASASALTTAANVTTASVVTAPAVNTTTASQFENLTTASNVTSTAGSSTYQNGTSATYSNGTGNLATVVASTAGVTASGGAAAAPSALTGADSSGNALSSTDTYSGVIGVELKNGSTTSQLYTATVAPGSSLQTVVTALNNAFGNANGNTGTSGLQAADVNNALVIETTAGTSGQVVVDAPTNSLQVRATGDSSYQSVSFSGTGSTTTSVNVAAAATGESTAVLALGSGASTTQLVAGNVIIASAGGSSLGTITFNASGVGGATSGTAVGTGIGSAIAAAFTGGNSVSGNVTTYTGAGNLAGYTAAYNTATGALTIAGGGGASFQLSSTTPLTEGTSGNLAAPSSDVSVTSSGGTVTTGLLSSTPTVVNNAFGSSVAITAATGTSLLGTEHYSGSLTVSVAGSTNSYTTSFAAGTTLTAAIADLNATFGSTSSQGGIGTSGLQAVANANNGISIVSAVGDQVVIGNGGASSLQITPVSTGVAGNSAFNGTTTTEGYTAAANTTASSNSVAFDLTNGTSIADTAVEGTLFITNGPGGAGAVLGSIAFGTGSYGSTPQASFGAGGVQSALATTFAGGTTSTSGTVTTYTANSASTLAGYSATYDSSNGTLTVKGPSSGSSFSVTSGTSGATELQVGSVSNPGVNVSVTSGTTTIATGAAFAANANTVYTGTLTFGNNTSSYAIAAGGQTAAQIVATAAFQTALTTAGLSATNTAGVLSFQDTTANSIAPTVSLTSGTATNPAVTTYTASSATIPPSFGSGNSATYQGVLQIGTGNVAALSTTFAAGTTAGQAATQLTALSGFTSAGFSAAAVNGNLVITGPAVAQNSTAAQVAADQITFGAGTTLTGVTATTQTITNGANAAVGNAGAATTYTGTINFGAVGTTSAGSFVIGSNNTGTTASAIAAAFNSATGAATTGITASVNTNNELVFTGPSSGSSLSASPGVTLTNLTATAAASTTYSASTASFAANVGGTFSGNLSVGTASTGQIASTIASGTTLANLVTQLNNQYTQLGVASQISASAGTGSQAGELILTAAAPTTAGQVANDTLSFSTANGANTLTATASTAGVDGGPGSGVDFTQSNVATLTASSAQTVLSAVTTAINDVAYQRGLIGADVNELTAASNVTSAESVNLTSAQATVQQTDYGQATSDLAKYQVLSQTGISALAQANSVQQEVLKLLQ